MIDRNAIISLPDPTLRQRSKRIGLITDDVKQLIKNMKAATLDWEAHRDHEFGVALAAVQINWLQRAVIVRSNLEDREQKDFTVMINPTIVKRIGPIEHDYEGCLSIKDVYGKVPRHHKIKVKALDESGKEFRMTLEGFLARVVQHEIDHTNGIMFIDHIKDDHDAFYKINDEGKLEALDYQKDVKNSSILWE